MILVKLSQNIEVRLLDIHVQTSFFSNTTANGFYFTSMFCIMFMPLYVPKVFLSLLTCSNELGQHDKHTVLINTSVSWKTCVTC